MTPEEKQIVNNSNQHVPAFIKLMGGKIIDLSTEKNRCVIEFNIGKEYCHSVDIVQGGFTTAMLDAAMSHAVFMLDKDVVGLSSLEIKTTYLDVTRAGKLRVEGWWIKKTFKTVFMEAHVYNEDNILTATASSVAKLSRTS